MNASTPEQDTLAAVLKLEQMIKSVEEDIVEEFGQPMVDSYYVSLNSRTQAEIQAKLQRPEYAPIAQSLAEVGMYNVIDLFSNYAGNAQQLQPWLADATINLDRNLKLQYLAGLGVHLYQSDVIYAGMLRYADYPEGTFTGSPEMLAQLREAMRQMQGRGY